MARTVFKIAEVVARRLVGSIPTRSRQNLCLARTNWNKMALRLRFGAVYAVAAFVLLSGCNSYVPNTQWHSASALDAPKQPSPPGATPPPSALQRAWQSSESSYKVSKGLLFVALPDAETPYNDVQVYDVRQRNPKPLAHITNGVNQPETVCIDEKRTLYVVNALSFVSEYHLGSLSPFAIITQGIDEPASCAIDKNGNLWVTNVGGENVTEYLSGSSVPHKVITKGLPYPVGLAFDHAGNLYVSNNGQTTKNIQVFLPGRATPSRTITDGVQWPVGIGVDATGTLYVANLIPGNIAEYRSGANKPYHIITQEMNGPVSLTFARGGWMYVSNQGEQGGGTGPAGVVLEFRPHSEMPSKKMIKNGLYVQEGVAIYPPEPL